LLGLVPIQSGTITWEGKPWSSYRGTALKEIRRSVQIVFQDPYSSLNPLLTVGAAIAEPLQVHRILRTQEQRRRRVQEWLDRVGLSPDHYFRYPHEFSGGQRQRVVIARALAMEPDFLVCDESVSALDTSVQAQVLNLLNDLKAACGFTMIFISHDLSVVRYLSDRIMVMNRGKIEEIGPAEDVYQHPKCSYTRQLIDSLPRGIA
jgi:peptide/nickel transport system ATP-binding protein